MPADGFSGAERAPPLPAHRWRPTRGSVARRLNTPRLRVGASPSVAVASAGGAQEHEVLEMPGPDQAQAALRANLLALKGACARRAVPSDQLTRCLRCPTSAKGHRRLRGRRPAGRSLPRPAHRPPAPRRVGRSRR